MWGNLSIGISALRAAAVDASVDKGRLMPGKNGVACLWVAMVASLSFFGFDAIGQAQTATLARPLITGHIDESKRVTLQGNRRPEATTENDRGPVADSTPMDHMLLQLRRSPEQEQALQQFIDELHTQGSPNFHQWITARQFGERFGVAQQDLDTITGWLESHGFKVNVVYPSGMVVDFSGTANQVHRAFQTEIHNLEVKGEKHTANVNDPSINADIANGIYIVIRYNVSG